MTDEVMKTGRLADFADGNLERPYQPEHPAYLLYTSGSTGKPKGVLIPHRALSNHCQAIQTEFALQPSDRALQFASLSFDVAAEEIFPTWAAGGTLLLRSADLPLSFTDYVAAQRLTVLNLPASYWHEWVASSADAQQNIPDCVRLMVVGSEKVSPARWAQWQTIAPAHTRWLNGYGPTETTITATLYEPSQNATIATTAMPIGKPIANVTAHVLDEHLQPVPTGVVGELYIGGAGLALGYLARPARTAQAFITHPQSGQRLYKTGDLVRRLADGNLAFIGRADNQAKVRGFRIELGEIEAALRLHPHVRDCLVVTRELADQPTQLVAYCVMDEGDTANLRQFLQTQLPSYMIPATFVPLEQFSYTPNGKIDRRALPTPSLNGANSYVAPTNETEQCVADIWADMLDRPQVGIHDNFFDLGGHSLIATQIVSRIRQALGVELPIRTLFESPTVAELVKNLPTTDLFDESEEALLADLMSEFDNLDFDELEDLI
ncbi:MAG: hypothetical protein DHS20C20_30120 [Ardenticatenaceae bacterium]|nr:MAG: hypothetical protein DHS20C20_30120 [Ardenticatenaceae bacterium]